MRHMGGGSPVAAQANVGALPLFRTTCARLLAEPPLRSSLMADTVKVLTLLPFLMVLAKACGAEPDSSKARPTASPQALAAGYERAGRKAEAAAIYEELARTNSVARKVLAPRLVQIYAQTDKDKRALAWAHEVMRDNPDPQAYLAGVHSLLGQQKRAQEILEREIAANTNATRAVTLRWQLADVHEKAGDRARAHKALEEAATAAKGTPMAPAAEKRLSGVKQ